MRNPTAPTTTIVRGSSADAFEVRLDGVPIYNPRHLFGLADAFNLDALRAVALHYGVPPARSAAPPGGTLEYVTSAGALRQRNGRPTDDLTPGPLLFDL